MTETDVKTDVKNDAIAENEPLFDIDEVLPETAEFTAEEDCGRLDAFISEKTGLTRSRAEKLIKSGAVLVDGKPRKAGFSVRAGSKVSVTLPPPEPTELIAEDIPLDIVYQDADIAVINKPAGMVVHPAAGNPSGTLVNALMFHIKDLSGIGGELRPGIVHRIDKDTSGLIVIAKNDAAHNFLSSELKTHSVARTYIALATGGFREDSGTVDAPIARHRTDRKKMAVVPGGREAVTHWRVLERFPGKTLLEVELETGRTHQIRVHMAYIGHPLVGDPVYGRAENGLGFTGQALHAARLRLTHPRTGERMEFTAPLPEVFNGALEKLRRENRNG
ncbi:MAG: RluA family pseudouridine synthase [Clostridia bacterium]|nr:RluA family pseudouridine synthase [Clostridia bacterium]